LSPKIEAHGASQGRRYGAEMPSLTLATIEVLFRGTIYQRPKSTTKTG
jgi:hypothetical protein